jgi:hypothetical protein
VQGLPIDNMYSARPPEHEDPNVEDDIGLRHG